MDPLNLYLQVALIGGAILASPFILYQVWLFIAPGLYQKERRFVIPFMGATVGLFLTGAAFGYFFVLPGALKILIVDFGKKFNPVITIEEYTGFFLSIILGLGISFELPILIFFLALFGIVSPRFLWKNIRYAILAVFLVAAIICPSPDPGTMCIYAIPMLALYMLGIGVAWWVHPSRRKAKEATGAGVMIFFSQWKKIAAVAAILDCDVGSTAYVHAQAHFDGAKAYEYARQFVAIGPRWPTGPGHPKAEAFLRDHFQHAHDQLEEDTFTANTPIGPVPMRNFIVRYPGKKNGVIVLASHYETNYPLRKINFVGANDGAATTGLLMAIGDRLHAGTTGGKKLDGYSVWLVFFDGEEAINTGRGPTRPMAAGIWPPNGDATERLGQIKAFILADMIGDKDLDIQRETSSTGWLVATRGTGCKEVWLRALFLSTRHAGGRRSSGFRGSRRSVDRCDRSGLRARQQLPPHRAGHDGQGERAQFDDCWRCVHGDDPAH